VGDVLFRSAGFLLTVCGMAWLALAMDAHFRQVRGEERLGQGAARALRALGVTALAASLILALWIDHGSMAPLVWVMTLTASALVVAMTLAFRPRWLAWLLAWLPKRPA
jgi:hypothetical protein